MLKSTSSTVDLKSANYRDYNFSEKYKSSLYNVLRKCSTVFKELEYCRFPYAETWELVNLLVGTKIISYYICFESSTKYLIVNRQRQKCERNSTTTSHYANKEWCIT